RRRYTRSKRDCSSDVCSSDLEWLATLFFAAAIIISGYKPMRSAYYAVKSGSLDMNVLMSAAAIGAALIGEWFEGATVVWLFSFRSEERRVGKGGKQLGVADVV